MALSVAHFNMLSQLDAAKLEQRIIMQKRVDKRVQELEAVRKIVQRKKDAALIEFFFAFQVFLAGAFISALWYA